MRSNVIGAFLRSLGVAPEDRVCLFMDKIPELYIGFVGVLKIGAIAQPLFSAFGDESLFVRLDNAGTSAIITQRKHVSKVRKIHRPAPESETHHRRRLRRQKKPASIAKSPSIWTKLQRWKISAFIRPPANRPSVLHYTSGTTGQPKGVKHVHYSLISQYLTTKWVLDLHDDDIYWCTADPGWVTGTSYGIIGAFSWASRNVSWTSVFPPMPGISFIEKHRITVWYSAPTAIRSLMKAGDEIVKKYDLSCLRHLASVGEPLNPEAVVWSEQGVWQDVSRHLLADRNRQHHDLQLSRHENQTGIDG